MKMEKRDKQFVAKQMHTQLTCSAEAIRVKQNTHEQAMDKPLFLKSNRQTMQHELHDVKTHMHTKALFCSSVSKSEK